MKANTIGKFAVGFLVWAAVLSVINALMGNNIVMFIAVGLCGAWLWNTYEGIA